MKKQSSFFYTTFLFFQLSSHAMEVAKILSPEQICTSEHATDIENILSEHHTSEDEYFSELTPALTASYNLLRLARGVDETIDAALNVGYTYVCIGIKNWFQSKRQS